MNTDPRFPLARRESKCLIDPRFQRLIDPRFQRVIESMVEESGEDDTDTDTDTDESIDESYGLQIPTNIPIETHRLSIIKMEWSRVSAKDLLLFLNPFLPRNGRILSVAVYPSERMREDGPDNEDYHAVIECDSSATALHLYTSCDGIEFERSSNKLDLRLIGDSEEFNHPPLDIANESDAGDDNFYMGGISEILSSLLDPTGPS